ncbi:ribonuclease H-like protein [Annulohypoxylon moriforme]|nr:ribonuclease H-like protein [Annulohypoxylon moriforme]
MAQGNGPRGLRCDCASAFDTPQSFSEHVRQTGHMKHRWCTSCNRLFSSKRGLEQHKKTAEKHKKNSVVPIKTTSSVSSKKPAADKPKAVPKKSGPTPTPTPPKTAGNGKGKAKAVNNPTKNPTAANSNVGRVPKVAQMSIPIHQAASLAETSSPHANHYPWASGRQNASLIKAAMDQCHSESRLLDQGYYTGDPAYRGHQKFSVELFVSTPPRVNRLPKRKAVALDCEMVGIKGGRDELAYLVAIDLFTGQVLINTLVTPTEPVTDWRTKWSGVTAEKMATAKVNGNVLDGWLAAREKLFQLVDADTTLVGHALNHDLKILRIAHKRVIDSGILVAEAVFGRAQRLLCHWGLKRASQEILGIKIQTSKKGHDCLEDTLASRELVLWCLKEREKLSEWGRNALVRYNEEKQKRAERQRAETKAKKEKEEREKREKEWQSIVALTSVEVSGDDGDAKYFDYYFDDGYDYDYAQLHGTGGL